MYRVERLTLSYVNIDAQGMHWAMQFGVALSRATSSKNVSISNLDWKLMKAIPSELHVFLQAGQTPPLVCVSILCCKCSEFIR